MARRLSLLLALLLAGAAFLVATAPAGQSGESRKGGTLRLASFQEVDSVDTALAYTPWSFPIVYATCAKLFNHPDASGLEGAKVVPEVVKGYTVSRDGRTYIFDLKRTFRFSTGAPVTAQSIRSAVPSPHPAHEPAPPT